jgi:hypothetical protein
VKLFVLDKNSPIVVRVRDATPEEIRTAAACQPHAAKPVKCRHHTAMNPGILKACMYCLEEAEERARRAEAALQAAKRIGI